MEADECVGDVVGVTQAVDEPCCRVHHRLKTPEQAGRKTGQDGISVVQPRQYQGDDKTSSAREQARTPLFAGNGQRHLPDVRELVLLDAAGSSTVHRPRARARRRLPQPPGPRRRRSERAGPGYDGGVPRRRARVGRAAAAALAALGRGCGGSFAVVPSVALHTTQARVKQVNLIGLL